MRRKIIKQGHNTLTLTLPSDWAKQMNLSAGTEVEVIEKDNGLFISTEKQSTHRRAEFNISNMDIPTIWKYFMAVYREGYSEVVVRFNPKGILENPYKFLTSHRIDFRYEKEKNKKTMLEVLQGFVNRFVGFEIVSHGSDYIVIHEMGDLTSREFDNSLRRVFLLIQQMAEETLYAIKSKNPSLLEHIHDVDINVDKFHDYCVRILNKIGNKEQRKTSLLFSTLYMLELLGDEFKNISHHICSSTKKLQFARLEDLASSVKEQIDAYYDCFYKFDEQKIRKISEIDSKTYILVPKSYKGSDDEEKEIYHHLRMISRYINALLELRIEMEF
jgi:phosphate uptake regulator